MMKKVGVAMMLGSKTRCRWRKKGLKTIIVRGKLPAGEATKAPPLGSTLGLYGVKADEFCTFYNKDSLRFYKKGLIIPFVVFISSTKSYIVEYKIPSVYTLITAIFSGFKNKVVKKSFFPRIKRGLIRHAEKKKKILNALISYHSCLSLALSKLTSLQPIHKSDIVLKEGCKELTTSRLRRLRPSKKANIKKLREALYVICWMKSPRQEGYFLRKWFTQMLGSFDSCNFFDRRRFIKIDKWAYKKNKKKKKKKK